MIKFRKKEFTIPEGHYTGPKDVDKIPGAVEMIAKGALAGAGIGGVAGGIVKDKSILEGALTGTKYGALGGIVAKFFLNYIHKPMTKVKYQEVDKLIRRQFGVYRMSGITVGDSLDKRAKIDDKFSFNDRDVSSYKINFAVHNNQITMYTFGMTREELDKTSKTLDYYCKKYYSMEYTAKIINQKVNSYSVDITFTNYHVISQFIMELSEVLNTKINLLDNDAIILPRLSESAGEGGDMDEERDFSIGAYDTLKSMVSGIVMNARNIHSFGGALVGAVQGLALDTITGLQKNELQKIAGNVGRGGYGLKREDYDNTYLRSAFKRLKYIPGFHYTDREESAELNMSLVRGIFVVSVIKSKCKELDEKFWKSLKTIINRQDTGKVIIYTHALKDIKEFDVILNKLMSAAPEKPNLYEKPSDFKALSKFAKNVGKPKAFETFIKFRPKTFSMNTSTINKVKEKLENDQIEDFEVSDDKIPTDVISITANLNGLKIYIPKELEDFQYDLDDFIREQAKFVRTNTILERNIFVMKLNGSLTFTQYYKVIKYIIEEQGFCTILNI